MNPSQAEMIYYQTLCQERNNYDVLVWQTPVLSLTGQAFLLTIALNPNSNKVSILISALLALLTALASVMLLVKHRYFEKEMSIFVEEFEIKYRLKKIHSKPFIEHWWEKISSFRIWFILLLIFAASSLFIIIYNCFWFVIPMLSQLT